jgi:hypothetical protein
MYITPSLASSRKFWSSWKYTTLTAKLVLSFRACNLLFLVTALIKNNESIRITVCFLRTFWSVPVKVT